MTIYPKKLDFNVKSLVELDVVPQAAAAPPKAHNPVPEWPAGSVPDDSMELIYIISMDPDMAAKRLTLYFSSRPPEPAPRPGMPSPGLLEIWGVTKPCKITLQLDKNWAWEFDHARAIDFDDYTGYPGAPRYFNLRNNPLDANGRLTSVSFHAERYIYQPAGTHASRDRFTFNVNITQADDTILTGSYDPDIKNPGDDP